MKILRDDQFLMKNKKILFPKASELPPGISIPSVSARILVDGRILRSGFETQDVFSPCSLENEKGELYFPKIGTTPHITPDHFVEVVETASRAWSKGLGAWPSSRVERRVEAVGMFRDQMLLHRQTIAELLMWEIGKSWADSCAEFDRTIQYINDTLQEVVQLHDSSCNLRSAGGILAQIHRAPLGVTLCMGPFNYPLNETFTTLIPALIMGNIAVIKLPRYGQLLWDCLLEPFQNCFPAGVVSVINGDGKAIIQPGVKTGKIDVLAFIGSSQIANQIKGVHPKPHHFRTVLGLDAKNPAVILADADLENAANECLKGALSFNGQRCTAIKILFVHRSIVANFIDVFQKKLESLSCGLPWEKNVMITPLPDSEKPGALAGYVADAVKKGAVVCNEETGGQGPGSIFFPVLLRNVPLTAEIAHQEQFGPIVPIVEFDQIEEVESYIFNSPYGLQASLFWPASGRTWTFDRFFFKPNVPNQFKCPMSARA